MERAGYYFGAGPAALPDALLNEAKGALFDFHSTGLSILEIGHRTPDFMALLEQAVADLREILQVPSNYQILLLGGAARAQFSMIPLNFVTQTLSRTAYLCTGFWSQLAFEEAKRLSDVYLFSDGFSPEETAYAYYTPNETIDGVYTPLPDVQSIPLVADMTSCLLSEPIDVSKFGLIFAGAQKNIGPAGLTLVIVRDDLLARVPSHILPTMQDYRVHAKHHSVYATPPVFQCFMAAKMFEWVKAKGGVRALHEINQKKAAKLYNYIDNSPHYQCLVSESDRSLMNVCFSMTDKNKEASFLKAAEKQGLKGLKGHRLKGGLRASLYNAMPIEGVEALIRFMDSFIA